MTEDRFQSLEEIGVERVSADVDAKWEEQRQQLVDFHFNLLQNNASTARRNLVVE